jgi:hypothetical protein
MSLSWVNQDVNEKHFGNVRERAGSHQGPNQGESVACVPLTAVVRLQAVERGNCPDAPDKPTTEKKKEKVPQIAAENWRPQIFDLKHSLRDLHFYFTWHASFFVTAGQGR